MKELTASLEIKIRFSETDAMGVVWHGNYLKFFEDGREFFGEKFELSYLEIYQKGFLTPLVKTEVNHKKTLHYGDSVRIETSLEFSKSAKIIHHYKVFNASTNEVCATGKTVQVFMENDSRDMILSFPSFYSEWLQQFA